MRKKMLASLLILVVIMGVALTCPVAGKDTVSIRFQIHWGADSDRGKAIRKILDEFEKENPGIKVELLGGLSSGEKILTDIMSGNQSEVIDADGRLTQLLGVKGAFVEMPKTLQKNKKDFFDFAWQQTMSNGKMYGYPWLGYAVQLVYNKNLFKEAGITKAPETWDELYETAKKLTRKGNDGKQRYGIGLSGKQHVDTIWMYTIFALSNGAKFISGDKPGDYKVLVNSKEGLDALNYYLKLVKEASPLDTPNKNGADVMDDFRNQVVAMELQGPWGATDIWKNGIPFEVGIAQIPKGPAGSYTYASVNNTCITVGTKGAKLKAAVKFVEYLGSKKAQEMLLYDGEPGKDGRLYPFRTPVRNDLVNSGYFKQYPQMFRFVDGFAVARDTEINEAWARIKTEIMMSELNKAVAGLATSEEALRAVQEKGESLVNK